MENLINTVFYLIFVLNGPHQTRYIVAKKRIWDDKNDLWMEAVNRRNDEHARSSDAEKQNTLL